MINLLLDSGAFSFWKRGGAAPLQDYIEYCKKHAHEVDAYVALDEIPGENGKMDHSQAAIEKSAAKSYENLQVMKDAGLKPIPVFHQGERFYWLEKMLEEGETYVGISPYLRSHQNEIIEWMDKAFTRITDSKGRPLIGTHGFGVTASVLCTRYPWRSVDSTTWSVGGGYGRILVPKFVNGKPDYSKPPKMLKMSSRKQDQSDGYDGLSLAEQDCVREYSESIGVPLVELRNSFLGRWAFNMEYLRNMAASCSGNLFKNRTGGMFDRSFSNEDGYQPQPLKMYMATVLHTAHHNIFLNKVNINNRLLSYAFLKDLPDDTLSEYIKTGLAPGTKKAKPRKMSIKMIRSEVYRVKRSVAALQRASRIDENGV